MIEQLETNSDRKPVITSPVKSFASRYNALLASGLQDE